MRLTLGRQKTHKPLVYSRHREPHRHAVPPVFGFAGESSRGSKLKNIYKHKKKTQEYISKVKGEGAVRINNYPDINMISSEIFLE